MHPILFQVGTWTNGKIEMEDVFWPKNSKVPPTGKPAKYKLKIVTLDEDPYVKFSDPDEAGECPTMSYPCRMKSENITNA